MKPSIKVRVVSRHHVSQLHLEHYWPWDYKRKFGFDFSTVKILGRVAGTGHILCQKGKTLRLINCCAFIDWACATAGAVLPNGEYAPTPHNKYADKAKAEYENLPQLFQE